MTKFTYTVEIVSDLDEEAVAKTLDKALTIFKEVDFDLTDEEEIEED